MTTVIAGVVGVLVIIVPLVAVLLVARARLVPSGEVRLSVNDDPDHSLTVRAGSTLLDTLAQQGVFVPSACGGQGTCGVCKVKVTHGGGTLLPTERTQVNRAEAASGVRLSCQLKVKEDLAIELPPEIFDARSWTCTVRSNRNVATFIKELVVELPEGESVPFRAGGYVQVQSKPYRVSYRDFDIEERFRGDWDRFDMWRYVGEADEPESRAYSMANYPGEEGVLMLNVRIASPPPDQPDVPPGIVSSYLFSLKPGDELMVSGPFGEFFARETDAEMMFIGGGAGMAPMRAHIFDQLLRLDTRRRITFWYGARSLKEAFYVEDFDRLAREHDNFEWHLALSEPLPEDDWSGPTGFIHQVALDAYLDRHPAPEDVEYYLCGPPPMIRACEKMLSDLGVDPENVMYDEFG
jgi:Na+-transporting NADH:ubiquinone oxidoreductase subunit F